MTKAKMWVITTGSDRPIHDIARDLADRGLVGGVILEETGVITGSAAEKVVAKLRKVRGVADVSPDIQVDIGPPDSPVTW